MAKPQRKTLFIAVLVVVGAFGVIGPLGARWLGPREAAADASTPILIEDPDASVFTIPPGEDPEAITDEFGTEPILIVDGPEAFTTSVPEEETTTTSTTTSAATSTSPTTTAAVDSETAQTIVTSTSAESQVATTSTSATTTTLPVRLDAQSTALVTEESSSGGLLIVLAGLLFVTVSGAMFGWRWRRGSAS